MKKNLSASNAKSQKSNPAKESAKSEISIINLDSIKDQLQGMDLKEKGENAKSHLYIYPEGWGIMQINGLEGKNFRNKRRRNLDSICNDILFYLKGDQMEKMNDSIAKFESNYKEFYRINDYSLSSLSNSKDEKKNHQIILALEIIKKMKG